MQASHCRNTDHSLPRVCPHEPRGRVFCGHRAVVQPVSHPATGLTGLWRVVWNGCYGSQSFWVEVFRLWHIIWSSSPRAQSQTAQCSSTLPGETAMENTVSKDPRAGVIKTNALEMHIYFLFLFCFLFSSWMLKELCNQIPKTEIWTEVGGEKKLRWSSSDIDLILCISELLLLTWCYLAFTYLQHRSLGVCSQGN